MVQLMYKASVSEQGRMQRLASISESRQRKLWSQQRFGRGRREIHNQRRPRLGSDVMAHLVPLVTN